MQITSDLATVEFHRSGPLLTIGVSGELDCCSVDSLTDQIMARLGPTGETVCMNSAAVTFCGAAGVRMVAAIAARVEGRGGRFLLHRPSPPVTRLLELLRPPIGLDRGRAGYS